MASICCVHFRPLAMCTPSSLKVVTRSTGVPLRLTGGGGSLTTEPISSSFVLRPFTILPTSVACWTSSSTNNCMLLTADLLKNSVIVVSSAYLCVRQPGCSASIKMINITGPRYDPCGMPADGCNQSDRTSPIFTRCRRSCRKAQWRQVDPEPPAWRPHVMVNLAKSTKTMHRDSPLSAATCLPVV